MWTEKKRGKHITYMRDTTQGPATVKQKKLSSGFYVWRAEFANGYGCNHMTPEEAKAYVDYHADRRDNRAHIQNA
jgi:hypothetical protein